MESSKLSTIIAVVRTRCEGISRSLRTNVKDHQSVYRNALKSPQSFLYEDTGATIGHININWLSPTFSPFLSLSLILCILNHFDLDIAKWLNHLSQEFTPTALSFGLRPTPRRDQPMWSSVVIHLP